MIVKRVPRIVYGAGVLASLPQELEYMGARRVLVVSDPGIVKAGILDRVLKVLEGFEVETFTEVVPEPPIESVEKAFAEIKGKMPDAVVAVGGGSTIDTAKALSAMFTNGKPLRELLGIEKVEKDPLPMVAIPTTSGTGAEATPNAIFTDTEEKVKKAIVSEKIIPRVALLDPELTLNLPKKLTASTGVDALSHCLESFTSRKASLISDMYAKKGLELILSSIEKVYFEPDVASRENMALGSLFGGIALTNAGTWATHALAYPLAGRYHLPHGVTIALFLPYVFAKSLPSVKGKISGLLDFVPGLKEKTPEGFVRWMFDLVRKFELPYTLKDVGVKEGELEEMAKSAYNIRRLMDNCPYEMPLEDVREIYRNAFDGNLGL